MVDTTAAGGSASGTSESRLDTPPAAPAPPARNTFKKWRARFIVLVLLAAAIYFGYRLSQGNVLKAAQIDLGTVTLTSQVVPVETPRPGQVVSVDVKAEDKVTAGQQLGSVQVIATDSQGKPVVSTLYLTAPRSGIVVDDPVTVGSTLQPGQAFVQLYDPTKLMFSGQVPLSSLPEISPGMVATLRAQGLKGTVKATVQRAVPRVGTSQTDVKPDHLKVVLVPTNAKEVAGLIPGLQFTGTVDTGTAPAGRDKLVHLG
jgi:multidrug resistance efflux pump